VLMVLLCWRLFGPRSRRPRRYEFYYVGLDNLVEPALEELAPRVDKSMIRTETEKTRLFDLVRKVGPLNVVYDCGSRDALDGLELAIEIGAKELHIFECNPPAVEICRKNVVQHKPDSLTVFINDCAISDKPGPVSFFPIDIHRTITPSADGNPGASSLFKADPKYPHEKYVQNTITVRATTLDEYSLLHRPPDLLWMDLQGAELMALKGGRNALKTTRIVHTEVAFRPTYQDQVLFWELDKHLRSRFKRAYIEMGRWPYLLPLYRLLRTGPWTVNAVYVQG
jgi:FkbM family methyltransferase